MVVVGEAVGFPFRSWKSRCVAVGKKEDAILERVDEKTHLIWETVLAAGGSELGTGKSNGTFW